MKQELVDSINESIRNIIMEMLKELDNYDFDNLKDESKVEVALTVTAGYIKENGELKVLRVKDNQLQFEDIEIVEALDKVIKNYTECLTFYQTKNSNSVNDKDLLEFVRAQMPASVQEEATVDDILKYAKEYK